MAATISATLLANSPSVYAIPTLTLSDGVNTVTVVDGSGSDLNSTPGIVTYSGSIGNWLININTGMTKPFSGSPSFPSMDLSSLNLSIAPGVLTIRFSENNFSPIAGSIVGSIGGTTAGNVMFKTYASLANIVLAEDILLTSEGAYGPGSFNGSAVAALASGTPYSLTMETVITHDGFGDATAYSARLKLSDLQPSHVSDGGLTAGLLGFTSLGLETLRRCKTRRTQQDPRSINSAQDQGPTNAEQRPMPVRTASCHHIPLSSYSLAERRPGRRIGEIASMVTTSTVTSLTAAAMSAQGTVMGLSLTHKSGCVINRILGRG
jgi:hypothetical protein